MIFLFPLCSQGHTRERSRCQYHRNLALWFIYIIWVGLYTFWFYAYWRLVILSLIWPFPNHNFFSLPHNAKFTLSMIKPCRQLVFFSVAQFSGVSEQQVRMAHLFFINNGLKQDYITEWASLRLLYEFVKQLKRGFEILITRYSYT